MSQAGILAPRVGPISGIAGCGALANEQDEGECHGDAKRPADKSTISPFAPEPFAEKRSNRENAPIDQ